MEYEEYREAMSIAVELFSDSHRDWWRSNPHRRKKMFDWWWDVLKDANTSDVFAVLQEMQKEVAPFNKGKWRFVGQVIHERASQQSISRIRQARTKELADIGHVVRADPISSARKTYGEILEHVDNNVPIDEAIGIVFAKYGIQRAGGDDGDFC